MAFALVELLMSGDVLTVPFKVRPAVGNFPEQLNANFSAALYLGRRRDSYSIKTDGAKNSRRLSISGKGYGYGGFIGIVGITMNPFVTNQLIDYEYDGFVLSEAWPAYMMQKNSILAWPLAQIIWLTKTETSGSTRESPGWEYFLA